jgi:hypothetical protein
MGWLKKAAGAVKNTVSNTTSVIKNTANNVRDKVQDTTSKVSSKLQDRKDAFADRIDRLQDNVEERFDKIRESELFEKIRPTTIVQNARGWFDDIDINSEVDKYLDRVKSNIPSPPVQPPLPDVSDVDNATHPNRLDAIVQKLTRPVDPNRAADIVTDDILNEIEEIIKDEGNDLWRERLDENGVFAEVISYIDEQLELQHQIMTNQVEITPPEEPDVPILEPNDARHMLIQAEEMTNLYTWGKELWDPWNQVVYTGPWHTRRTSRGMIPLSGETYRRGDSRVLQLIPASEEIKILEQVDVTPNPLDIEYETEPLTAYGARDASITLKIEDGTPPYTINWFRTDERGWTRPLNGFRNQMVIDNLGYGKYTAEIEDSYVEEEDIDLREDLGTEPDANRVKRLMDIILDKESRFNIDTQGWEFAIGDVPYVGKVHFVEMPIDVPVEDQTGDYTPVNPTARDIKETQDLFEDYAEKVYDEIMKGTRKAHRLAEYFKPHQPYTEVVKLKRPPRPPRIFPSFLDNIDDNGNITERATSLFDKIRERREERGPVFGNIKERAGTFGSTIRDRGDKINDRINNTRSNIKDAGSRITSGIRGAFGRRR